MLQMQSLAKLALVPVFASHTVLHLLPLVRWSMAVHYHLDIKSDFFVCRSKLLEKVKKRHPPSIQRRLRTQILSKTRWMCECVQIRKRKHILTGATKVRDLTESGCFTARARAIMHPKECATMWNDFTLLCSRNDLSIISKCSHIVYNEPFGFGLLPKPNRSIAKSLYLDFADFEKLGNRVSVQIAEDEINPWIKITFSSTLSDAQCQNITI